MYIQSSIPLKFLGRPLDVERHYLVPARTCYLFVKVPQPGDSEGAFSAFESPSNQGLWQELCLGVRGVFSKKKVFTWCE